MPTVLYIRRGGEAVVGQPAIDAYLTDNRDRGPVKREMTPLGLRVASSVPGIPPVEAHILSDRAAPGRFFQALKTFLGDELLMATSVFGDARGLSELIAILLAAVRERAAVLTGVAPETVTFGRPVEFVGGPLGEERALQRLRDAATLAGFREVRFDLEPVAAARAADVGDDPALVFDFGGGTLDVCVVRRTKNGLEVLATAGNDVGGDRLTELLIDEVVAPVLGARAEWGPKRLALPRYITAAIGDWHALSALNEKTILDRLDDLIRVGAPKRELAALRCAIELQLGYEIFAVMDGAKRRLSDEVATIVSYHRAAIDVDARLGRSTFERRLAPSLKRIDSLLDEVLARSGLAATDIRELVRTGGSSAIPSVRALLARRFPNAEGRDHAPFAAVAAGLARS